MIVTISSKQTGVRKNFVGNEKNDEQKRFAKHIFVVQLRHTARFDQTWFLANTWKLGFGHIGHEFWPNNVDQKAN